MKTVQVHLIIGKTLNIWYIDIRYLRFYTSSFLVNMNFILICFWLLINLNSTSKSSGDYIDNPRNALWLLLTQRFLTFRCVPSVKIKTTDIVLPVKEGPQLPWWQLFLWILPVARCPRIKIVKWEVAFTAAVFFDVADNVVAVVRQQFVMGINCSIFLYRNSFGANQRLALT